MFRIVDVERLTNKALDSYKGKLFLGFDMLNNSRTIFIKKYFGMK
jgi:hypothetical protein